MGCAVLAQYGLGIATLLLVVPPALAVIHQIGAVLVLTAVLVVLHASRARSAAPVP
jgi:cytochrome c oxidase assembly protein subunit 15